MSVFKMQDFHEKGNMFIFIDLMENNQPQNPNKTFILINITLIKDGFCDTFWD